MYPIMLSCLIVFLAQADPETSRPIVGAIRWDGWHGDASEVGLTVEKTLAPNHWHYRLPFFGKDVPGMVIARNRFDRRCKYIGKCITNRNGC